MFCFQGPLQQADEDFVGVCKWSSWCSLAEAVIDAEWSTQDIVRWYVGPSPRCIYAVCSMNHATLQWDIVRLQWWVTLTLDPGAQLELWAWLHIRHETTSGFSGHLYRRLRMPGPSLLLFGWNTVPVTMNLCAWLCRICLVWTFQRNRLISIYLKSFHLSSSDCDSQRLSLGHWHRGSGPGSFDYVILMILMRSGMSSRTLKSSLEYVEQRTPVSQLSQLS